MPQFQYTAIDASGKEKKGKLEADSADDANVKISAMGLMPTRVKALAGGSGATAGTKSDGSKAKKSGGKIYLPFSKIATSDEITLFTRQVSTLLKSSVPLVRSLEVMERQEQNERFKTVIAALADNVRSGNSLSDGLLQYPKIFDKLYVNMVRAGEAGGVLDVVMDRLATFMEKSQRMRKKVKSALVYPAVVVVVAVSIVVLLMIVVVPRFEAIFQDMLKGKALPGPTQAVMAVSEFIQSYWYIALALVGLGWYGFKMASKSGPGKRFLDRIYLGLPKVGDMVSKVNVGRFSRTLGTLLASGVPILEALTISRDVMSNSRFSDALDRVHDQVRDGNSVSNPLENESVFPDMVVSMIEVGEETGELPEMLNRVADTYDEDVDNAVGSITSIIEPVMIVFLALVVGFIVIALFLPIIEILRSL